METTVLSQIRNVSKATGLDRVSCRDLAIQQAAKDNSGMPLPKVSA